MAKTDHPKKVNLDLLSEETGIERSWFEEVVELDRLNKAVLNSLGLLDFLHGKEGEISTTGELPLWAEYKIFDWYKGFPENIQVIPTKIDWAGGLVHFRQETTFRGKTFMKTSSIKIGKIFSKVGASKGEWDAFETREVKFEYRISTDPVEVFTMSHNRAWTSCMKPGGGAERGLATDVEAGSAIMFFYRPGATQPCGRKVLRACLIKGKTFIIDNKVYGSGPDLSVEEMQKVLTFPVVQAKLADKEVVALKRDIYCDNSRETPCPHIKTTRQTRRSLLEEWKQFQFKRGRPDRSRFATEVTPYENYVPVKVSFPATFYQYIIEWMNYRSSEESRVLTRVDEATGVAYYRSTRYSQDGQVVDTVNTSVDLPCVLEACSASYSTWEEFHNWDDNRVCHRRGQDMEDMYDPADLHDPEEGNDFVELELGRPFSAWWEII